jgi:hypothetical protein
VAERVVAACKATAKTDWQEPYPYPAIPYSSEVSFAWFGGNDQRTSGDELLARIVDARRGYFLRDPLSEESFLRGEEARAGGIWAEPENWGTWLCQGGGEVALGLAPNDGELYDVFLRLRASGPVAELRVRLIANGDPVWEGAIGPQARNIIARVRRRGAGRATGCCGCASTSICRPNCGRRSPRSTGASRRSASSASSSCRIAT